MGSNATRVRWAQEKLAANPLMTREIAADLEQMGVKPEDVVTRATSVGGNVRTVCSIVGGTNAAFYVAAVMFPRADFGICAAEIPHDLRVKIEAL